MFEVTVFVANNYYPTCLKKFAQSVARNLLICIGVGLWTRRSPVHKGWRMESPKSAKRCFLGTLWEVRVHKKKRENPAETGPQRGYQKVRECFSQIAYGGVAGTRTTVHEEQVPSTKMRIILICGGLWVSNKTKERGRSGTHALEGFEAPSPLNPGPEL